ncbi:tetratricopeptide repeat protein [Georgenia sunbinii]|uniref:tetratricopeptide repeat protein n=1 Tax=Georgenia sunbinii TaxID=3117728 RepID=UPI002F26CF24
MSQPSLNLHGAVDLSGLARPSTPPAPGAPGPASATGEPAAQIAAPVIADVTEETFGQTVELSTQVPVVVELWAQQSGPAPELAALATQYGGRFHLARVDAQAQPQIAAAFQVQTVPSVVAVVGGQPVPLYQGSHPQEQLRQVLDEVLRMAAQQGVTGVVVGEAAEPAEPAEPPLPPLHAEAHAAIDREDYDAAADAYRRALAANPADAEARAALAQVELIQRTSLTGAQAVAEAEGAAATDVEAHLAAADVEVAAGQQQAAFDRLLAVVRATAGDEREAVRQRLIAYFELLGHGDPAVAAARRALASALY